MLAKVFSHALLLGNVLIAFNAFARSDEHYPPPLLGPENLILQPEYDARQPPSTSERLQYLPAQMEEHLLVEKRTPAVQEGGSVFEESRELYVGAEPEFTYSDGVQ